MKDLESDENRTIPSQKSASGANAGLHLEASPEHRPSPTVPRHRAEFNEFNEQSRFPSPYPSNPNQFHRRDPLNNPDERRMEPVSGNGKQKREVKGGPERLRRGQGHVRRTTVALSGEDTGVLQDTRSDTSIWNLESQTTSNVTDTLLADTTIVEAEADLFDNDFDQVPMESDDVEVDKLLPVDPPPTPGLVSNGELQSNFQFPPVNHGNSSLLRKRSLDDDDGNDYDRFAGSRSMDGTSSPTTGMVGSHRPSPDPMRTPPSMFLPDIQDTGNHPTPNLLFTYPSTTAAANASTSSSDPPTLESTQDVPTNVVGNSSSTHPAPFPLSSQACMDVDDGARPSGTTHQVNGASDDEHFYQSSAFGDADATAIPNISVVNGRQMVDVSTFNQTMRYLGKQSFINGFEEGRKAMLGSNPTPSPSESSSLNMNPQSSRKKRKSAERTIARSGADESDDESAHLKGRKSRKATGKRPPNEVFLMDGIRKFLREQGLCHERGGSFPQDVSTEELARFTVEGNSAGPKLATTNGTVKPMLLEWKKSVKKSAWNSRAVSILSSELFDSLKGGKVENVKFDSETMTLKYCEKQILQRLDRLRREKIADHENRLKAEKDRTDQIERRRSRRKTRKLNRLKVANRKARGGQDQIWDNARQVVETLKVDGQSGDETETEDVFGHRVVRRLRRHWLSDKISTLMVTIDSYSMEEKDLAGLRKQGNVGVTRHVVAINDDERPHMVNLPSNFYDAEWFRGLDEYEKAELNVQPVMEIPTIPLYDRS